MKHIISLLTEIRDLLNDRKPTQVFQNFSNTTDYKATHEHVFKMKRAQDNKETT